MSEQKYEVVGLTRAEAVRVAEQIGQGAVLWDRGHTYPDDGVIVRPMGCKCPQCSAQETAVDHESHVQTFMRAGPEQGMSTMCECGQTFAKHIAQDSAGNSCVCP